MVVNCQHVSHPMAAILERTSGPTTGLWEGSCVLQQLLLQTVLMDPLYFPKNAQEVTGERTGHSKRNYLPAF